MGQKLPGPARALPVRSPVPPETGLNLFRVAPESPSQSMGRKRIAVLALALGCACAELRGTERSTVSTSQVVSSAYWFRGSPRSLQPVTQADLSVNTPLANGATLSFVTWYNAQLTNETGDGTFPDGQGGEATEVDLLVNYAQELGGVDVAVGGIGYHYPEVAPSTREAYLGGTLHAFGLSHALTAYYDLDLLDDFYFMYQATRTVRLDEHWNGALAVLLGYMSDGQAEFYFGDKTSGLSDLLLTGSLTYMFDENTSLFVRGAGVTVPDDDLADALDQSGLDDSGMWFTLGAAWGL